MKVQGGGQRDVETCEVHLPHVAIDRTLDADRVVGIVADERLWQTTHEVHQVLFADLCKEPKSHTAWLQSVGNVKVEVGLCVDVRVGCAKGHSWQLDIVEGRVESDESLQL